MPVWETCEDSLVGLQCSGTPYCDFHDVPLKMLCAKPHTFLLADKSRAFAIDIEMTCPFCGCWDCWGVAISKDHYLGIIEKIRKERERKKEATWLD